MFSQGQCVSLKILDPLLQQGLKKVTSSCPGQVDLLGGKYFFILTWPIGQGPRQVNW